jgi:hypothetical protein
LNPIEEVQRALRSLADRHGVVLHTHVCEPWVIHPFYASPTATRVECGNRGWWATCMWCACGIATLVGGDATIHTRIGGEGEDIDIHVEKGRVRESDLWIHFAVPPRAAWDCVHHFCATCRSAAPRTSGPGATVTAFRSVPLRRYRRSWSSADDGTCVHADSDWRKWTVREAGEICRSAGLVGEFWDITATEGGF